MPRQEYHCEVCDLTTDVWQSIHTKVLPTIPCGYCNEPTQHVFPKDVNINVFKPYVEEHLGPQPIEITTAKQRDELCKKHDVTYDSARYLRKAKRDTWEKDLTFDQVRSEMPKYEGTRPDLGGDL